MPEKVNAVFLSALSTYYSYEVFGLTQACFLDVFPALEVSGFAGNLRFLEILP